MRTTILGLVFLATACPAEVQNKLPEQLLAVKRLYIDRFGGGDGAGQIRDMVIASLQRSGLFIVTENPERADAVLRGSAEDLVFTDTFQTGESVGARANLSLGRGASTRTRDTAAVGAGVSESENTRIQERKHEASASVRIVSKDGDVLWSTTQESLGAKFRSASADVADKVTRQLVADMEKAKARSRESGEEAARPGSKERPQ